MDGGKDVGIGIDMVEGGYQGGREVVTGKDLGTEILAVGDQEPDQDAGKESDRQEGHITAKTGRVLEQQVQSDRYQQGIPCAVKQDEPLTEGNAAIQRELGGPVVVHGEVLNQYESQEVERQPQDIFQILPGNMGQAQEYHLFICTDLYKKDSTSAMGKSWIFWE